MAAAVSANLLYFDTPLPGEKPWIHINSDTSRASLLGPPNPKERNYTYAEHEDVKIHQVDDESKFSLDTTGFEFHKHVSQEKNFEYIDRIQAYYDESIELIKTITGANRAVVFDHTIRRHRPNQVGEGPDSRRPVTLVHVDQTPESAELRVQRHLPLEDVPELLGKRYQIINLWRPIHHAAVDWPLALCDYRSVDAHDGLVRTTLRYPDRDGETFSVKFSDKHHWYYKKGMEPDDIVLIKCFDTETSNGIARFTPHTAFADPTAPPGAPLRESIELRLLVFYP